MALLSATVLPHAELLYFLILTSLTAVAQTSLAEILFTLNTGLVSIIASFLQHDKDRLLLDFRALAALSERSRTDTCQTLRQLSKRVAQRPREGSRLALEYGEQKANRSQVSSHRKRRRPVSMHAKIRGPTLARVTVMNSSAPSQVALVKPGERKKKSQSAGTGTASALSKASTAPPPYDTKESQARPSAQRSQTTLDVPKAARRKNSAQDVSERPQASKERLRATRSTPRLGPSQPFRPEELPPMPNTAPLPRMEHRTRKLTPTYYSIASDSTKIGEIPLNKWPVPFDFEAMAVMNKEAERNGWPVDQMNDDSKKKRFGLFRLFRRKEVQS